jgi:hypothetical protein
MRRCTTFLNNHHLPWRDSISRPIVPVFSLEGGDEGIIHTYTMPPVLQAYVRDNLPTHGGDSNF